MNVAELIAQTSIEPRPYQTRIVEKVLRGFLELKLRSMLIESPTGSGKTIMGLLIARGLQAALGVRVGWVAMRRHLLRQAEEANTAMGFGVQMQTISMFEQNPPTELDLLVVDEAQHDAANSMAHLHNIIQPRFILGLSATPYRADRVKLCFDSVVRDAGIQTLMADGYLSGYQHFTIPEYLPEAVAATYLREPSRWGKSVMFFHKLTECQEAADHLRKGGVACEVVTGSSDRETQFERFESGEVCVLINCMVLTEGFDCPDLRTVFCRPSAKSVTVQMAGRVLRKHASVPLKQIVQCSKTPYPFARTAPPRYQFVWEDNQWRSLTLNPMIEQIERAVLIAIAQSQVKLPDYVTKHQPIMSPFARFRDRY